MQIPLLNMKSKDESNGDKTLPQIEENLLRENLFLEQESYRRSEWEHLKHFRSKYDNEFP